MKKQQPALSKRVQERIFKILAKKEIPFHRYEGDLVRFGLISDTHIGSLYEHNEVLKVAYETFQRDGIATVYHCGDLLDGSSMYKGQEYEQYAHGAKKQADACIKRFPKVKGIKTYYILGNHDGAYRKLCGLDVSELIAKRNDLVCLGIDSASILVGDKKKAHIRLVHPGSGSSYAISYKPQKYIESLSGGQKPQAVFIGHFHKAEFLPCYRNVFCVQAGTIQGQTPFMASKNLAAHIGFWIIEFIVNDDYSITRFKAEFFAHYEETVFVNI